jgi:hypothetical protein
MVTGINPNRPRRLRRELERISVGPSMGSASAAWISGWDHHL